MAPTASAQICRSPISWPAITTPAVSSMESPGRNRPTMTAHSRKTKLRTTVHTRAGPADSRKLIPLDAVVMGSALAVGGLHHRDLFGDGVGVSRRGALAVTLALVAPALEDLQEDRHHRDEHDEQEDQVDVVADELDLAEQVAEHRDARAPQDRTDRVVGDEDAVAHRRGARDDRGEGAHERHEAGKDDGDRPVLFEEGVRFVDVLLLEQARLVVLEQRGPAALADHVSDLV